MKRILSLAAALLLAAALMPGFTSLTALAAGETDIKWFTIENGVLVKYAIASTGRPGGDIVIPSNAGITSIGAYAFYTPGTPADYADITSVVIPSGVKSIGNEAFRNSQGLTAVTIPEGVTSIGDMAFVTCRKLTSIVIPRSVKSIDRSAFGQCAVLALVTILGDPTVGDDAFSGCPARFTVTYDSQGGSEVSSVSVEPGTKLTSPNSTKEGLELRRWCKNQACTQTWNFAADPVLRDITLYAKWVEPGMPDAVAVPSDKKGIYINLTDETIELEGFIAAAYSVNGGTKWVKGSLPTGDKFNKLFDKELTLWLSDTYNERDIKEGGVVVTKKGVPDDANIVKFPKINARPKANEDKLAPVYKDVSNWWLAKKTDTTGTEVFEGYEFAPATNGKDPSGDWSAVPQGGVGLITGKAKKVYLFRSIPVTDNGTYIPGSKNFKITPANYGVAPKYKIDYKNEVIKLKNGDAYCIGTESFISVTAAKPDPIDLSEHLTNGTQIHIKKDATGKKPPTEVQEIIPPGRATLTDLELTCANGKITTDLKKYEVYDSAKKKWGGIPKTDGTYGIRLKQTVKGTSGNAASETGALKIVIGDYGDGERTKNGIIYAAIYAKPADAEMPTVPGEAIPVSELGAFTDIAAVPKKGSAVAEAGNPSIAATSKYDCTGEWTGGFDASSNFDTTNAVYSITLTPHEGYKFDGALKKEYQSAVRYAFPKSTETYSQVMTNGVMHVIVTYALAD